MLKKLRRKFVLINMAMVSVVVVVMLAVIGGISYQQSIDAVRDAMYGAIDKAERQAHGELPFGGAGGFGLPGPAPEDSSGPKHDPGHGGGRGPELGKGNDYAIPVAVYSVTTYGSVQMVSRASSAALSDDGIELAAALLSNAGPGMGELDGQGLFYVKEWRGGDLYYAFASTSSAADWEGLVGMLILIGIGTLLVFWLLSTVFSRWALKPVEEAWSSQKQFLADASHELKTPLTVILANTDIMLKHPERSIASQQQWLESTQHEARDMQEMVVSMLDLARLDAEEEARGLGNAPAQTEDINLSDVALGTMLQFESIAFEKSVSLADDIDDDLHIQGNPQQIERLCSTLLDNACKYAPADSVVTMELKVVEAASLKAVATSASQGTLPKGNVVALSVTNEGEPVSPEDLPHLFDRFYRSDKARTHDAGKNSYGLGLAIAAGTVMAHNGCIMATSGRDQGTTFIVALPLASC